MERAEALARHDGTIDGEEAPDANEEDEPSGDLLDFVMAARRYLGIHPPEQLHVEAARSRAVGRRVVSSEVSKK